MPEARTRSSTPKRAGGKPAVPKTTARKSASARSSAKAPAPKKNTGAKPSAGSKKVAVTPDQRYRMIAEAAYFIAEHRSFSGNPAQDWVEAEIEVDRMLNRKK